jgi:hypothetical protein
VLLQGVKCLRERRAGEDGVNVVVEDHPGVNFQGTMLAAALQRWHEHFATPVAGEDGQPFDDRRGDKPSGARQTAEGSPEGRSGAALTCAAAGSRIR